MNELVKWIATFLSIDAENSFITKDLIGDIAKLQLKNNDEVEELRDFIKLSKSHIDLKYENGLGKFYKIIEMYKQEKYEHLSEGIQEKARCLAWKIQLTSNGFDKYIYLCNDFDFSFIKADDEQYYSHKEVILLNKMGAKSIFQCLNDKQLLTHEILLTMKKFIQAKISRDSTQGMLGYREDPQRLKNILKNNTIGRLNESRSMEQATTL